MTDPSAPRPMLDGVKVLDLTTFLSGPFCTQVLADLGADVVKVEPPLGDSSRHIPPHFVGDDSAYFLANNRNKRSVLANLKDADDVALVRRLIAQADVVVDNYRPGVLTRLGLDPADLCAAHPALIWASISGFGQSGAWKDRPAYDMIVQAESGVMSLTGEPGHPSVRLGIPAGDAVAGLYATIGINAALADRARTGHGRMIDVSMLDCQLAMLSYQSAYALIGGVTPGPQGAGHDSIPTYRAFVAGDGRQFVITANTHRMWEGLCRAIGQPDLAQDARFATGPLRLENRAALWAILEPAFLTRDAADWLPILEEADVPVALIKTVPEAMSDARDYGRDMIIGLDAAEGRRVDVVGNPIKLLGQPARPDAYPPALGADRDAVVADWRGDGPPLRRESTNDARISTDQCGHRRHRCSGAAFAGVDRGKLAGRSPGRAATGLHLRPIGPRHAGRHDARRLRRLRRGRGGGSGAGADATRPSAGAFHRGGIAARPTTRCRWRAPVWPG